MSSDCLVLYSSDNDDLPTFQQATAQQVIDQAVTDNQLPPCILSVLFVDDRQAAALHDEHFGDPTTTDVMSFPDGSTDPDTGRVQLGDLAVCVDVAERQARLRGVSTSDELILYLVHGLLHLLGYDDQTDEDRTEMWQEQRRLLLPVHIDPGSADD
ncbi:MAG: rRNA maturation RNase YbeY [Planctomycetota bacterium]